MSGYLAAGDPQAGPIGLALVVVLGIAIAFLGRSMSKHLSRVPKSFDQSDDSEKNVESGEQTPATVATPAEPKADPESR
jgi:hypothetical protein